MNALVAMLQWALLVLGLTYLVTESFIFLPVRIAMRRLGLVSTVLVYCPACIGFWSGAGLGALGLWSTSPMSVGAPTWLVCTIQSAIAGCALAAAWSKANGGNPMFEVEGGLPGGES